VLAQPLRRSCGFGVRCRFLTTTLGVNPTYREETFYRATLEKDATRVNSLFARARAANVDIEHRSLTASELRSLCGGAHTLGGNLIIGLVDRRRLYRAAGAVSPPFGPALAAPVEARYEAASWSGLGGVRVGSRLGAGLSSMISALGSAASGAFGECLSPGGYVGHYVLITSYDDRRRGYYILDPAGAEEATFVADDDLNAARHAHGTDEDMLVIPWDQPARVKT